MRRHPEATKDWTYDTQLKIAEACHKAGFPIGFGCGQGQHRRQPDLGRHVRRVRR